MKRIHPSAVAPPFAYHNQECHSFFCYIGCDGGEGHVLGKLHADIFLRLRVDEEHPIRARPFHQLHMHIVALRPPVLHFRVLVDHAREERRRVRVVGARHPIEGPANGNEAYGDPEAALHSQLG